MIKGLYPGSFDPITKGHIDIIKRSLQFCDKVIVTIGINSKKSSFFTLGERLELIHQVIMDEDLVGKVDVIDSSDLMVNEAKALGAAVMIRGIRSVSDFEYEINLANINKVMAPSVETIFLPTQPEMAVVSSSAVKELAKFGVDISKFVSKVVADAINKKLGFTTTAGSTGFIKYGTDVKE